MRVFVKLLADNHVYVSHRDASLDAPIAPASDLILEDRILTIEDYAIPQCSQPFPSTLGL